MHLQEVILRSSEASMQQWTFCLVLYFIFQPNIDESVLIYW